MANAKKTASGKWRITIYDYRDSTGKTHQKTFTAETKREVERMVNEYKNAPRLSDLTIGEAVNGYITVKSASLQDLRQRDDACGSPRPAGSSGP